MVVDWIPSGDPLLVVTILPSPPPPPWQQFIIINYHNSADQSPVELLLVVDTIIIRHLDPTLFLASSNNPTRRKSLVKIMTWDISTSATLCNGCYIFWQNNRKYDQQQNDSSHFKPDPYVFFGRSIFIVCTVQTRKYFLLTMFLHKISWNITCHFSCCGGCEWLHSLQYENIFSICLYKANNGDYETKTMVERITTNITKPGHATHTRQTRTARGGPAWPCQPGHPTDQAAWPGH